MKFELIQVDSYGFFDLFDSKRLFKRIKRRFHFPDGGVI